VTGFGVFWAMLLLGESYSGWIWAALALMLMGLFLVQPRPRAAACARQEDIACGRAPRMMPAGRAEGPMDVDMVDLSLSQTGEALLRWRSWR
jgi:hypothetical protein